MTSAFALALGAKPRATTSGSEEGSHRRWGGLELPEATPVPDRMRIASSFSRQYAAVQTFVKGAGLSMTGKTRAILDAVLRETAATHPKLISDNALNELQAIGHVSIEQSLSVLSSVLASEETAVRLDYCTLFGDLCEVGDEIRVAVQESLEGFHEIESFTNVHEPHEVVFEIFRIAAKREALLLENQKPYWPDVLKICAAIFTRHISTERSRLLDEAKAPITPGSVVVTEQWSETSKVSAKGLKLRLKGSELTMTDDGLSDHERDLRATKQIHMKHFQKWQNQGIDFEVQASMAWDILQQQKNQAEREKAGKAGDMSASQKKNAARKRAKAKAAESKATEDDQASEKLRGEPTEGDIPAPDSSD
ncbi:hypothetical protein CLAFUW4_08541 [Fulvia fulva]|uniref:Uncharacterized protein n=1 Tax=Passalora fulva TaxID=5499 RepID=A0A9Q8LCA2_PASFU|nr:uncharacterized protein CLAFUR5_08643 [Fulvia fulva]KAK4629753.1 hypothetical protein CLAFUR4_08546 [Fulvia fulva]KAK4630411.1 hypothetical protein CLAFUR0_08541 [Fulvia fulva]UJO14749.1 hypothetical protein CLAFUR5_08643 [Fulvia fulva]WPV12336.1 hypothetical protein CLAFUW4_08541 [Fulvia fulva]WPV27376.1 hypothetical protein CLAFUW7_08541 [Fulvia fulva]